MGIIILEVVNEGRRQALKTHEAEGINTNGGKMCLSLTN